MKRQEILERIIPVIVEQLDVKESEVKEDANIEKDLGSDSLDGIELLMALEEETWIEISDKEANEIETVKDIIDLLEKKLK